MTRSLSVVTTLYRSEGHVAEFHRRVVAAAGVAGYDDVEVVYVNDGSPDASLDRALEIFEGDPRVVVVDLVRNAGHHRALMTGLEYARHDRVFLIDCDLEEPPELLVTMHAALESDDSLDVVYGVPRRRRGNAVARLAGRAFYGLLEMCSEVEIARDASTVRLMSRRYVDALLAFRESEVMIGGLFALAGFRQQSLPFDKKSASTSTYDLHRKVTQAMTALTSFSDRPLRWILGLGLVISACSLVVGTWLVSVRLQTTTPVHGFTSLMLSVWALGGVTLLVLGALGTALARVYRDAKRRPVWIARDVARPTQEVQL